MQGNVLGQSGSLSSGLNVYAQLSEPSKKDGVWIRTEETVVDENTTLPEISKYKYDKVELVDDIDIVNKGKYTKLSNIPYSFGFGAIVAINTNIYLFGSANQNNSNKAYKYDTLTDTYTALASTPTYITEGRAVVIGKDIYIFSNSSLYKYNTSTNTYITLTGVPYTFTDGSIVAIGTNIYLFGANNTNYTRYTYKYDTLTDTYTQLADIPFDFCRGSAVAIGNNIYLFGSANSTYQNFAYKYNILTNEYTQLANIPYNFYGGGTVTIDTNIYLLGSTNNNIYMYNIFTDTYKQLDNIPYNFYGSSVVAIGNNIYLLGSGHSSSYYNYIYKFQIIPLINKTIFIETIPLFKTALTKILSTYISNAKISTDTNLLEYPIYYGNGQEWIKI